MLVIAELPKHGMGTISILRSSSRSAYSNHTMVAPYSFAIHASVQVSNLAIAMVVAMDQVVV